MTEDTTTNRKSTRLLTTVIVLLCVVAFLQLGLLLQRHVAATGGPRDRLPHRTASRTLASRIQSWFVPCPPPGAITPDNVWNQAGEMEHMHAEINRMLERTFHDSHDFPPAPAAESNASTTGSSAPFPFEHINRMQAQIDAMFARAMNDFDSQRMGFEEGWSELTVTPAMSVRDTGATYEITLQIPGVDKSSLHVSMEGLILDIAVEVQTQSVASVQAGASAWHTHEVGRFERRLRLPFATSRRDEIKAVYTQGVLRISVPKTPGNAPEAGRIEVD